MGVEPSRGLVSLQRRMQRGLSPLSTRSGHRKRMVICGSGSVPSPDTISTRALVLDSLASINK